MSSSINPRWEPLAAPVKAALRWAWACSQARPGEADRPVDSLDLLAGIFLADLTDSPARIVAEHFRIPPGELLARPDSAPPTGRTLRELVGAAPDIPAVDRQVMRIIDDAFVSDAAPVSLPDLFGSLLSSESIAARSINDALSTRGTSALQLTLLYKVYQDGRRPLREFLRAEIPYQATGIALPDYLADQPDQPTDLVGIGPEVDAFAHLIASKRLVSPLAVGMFGEWGSGKSYFLRSLQRRIDAVSCAGSLAFHRSIVQIEFNAWQYVGGDLWASLVEHLFRNLRVSGSDSDDLLAERQQFWLQQLQGAGEAHQRAQDERVELEHEREAVKTDVAEYEQQLRDATEALERARQASPGDALKSALKEAADKAGLGEVTENAERLSTELAQARDDARSLLAPLRAGDKRYVAFVFVALVLTPAIAYLSQLIDLSSLVSTVVWLLGTATGYVTMAGRFIRDATERIAAAQARLAEAEADEQHRVEQEVQAAQEELTEVQSRLDDATQREHELAENLAEVQRSLDAATPSQVLTEFITERLASEDYRRHLGVPALVRRDLERLSRLVAAQQGQRGPHSIDRIVLYIDDLDRCPTPVVIKVLEAVHLLLAFPLFVVVVSVDARWLASSLREHYGQLAGPDATPEDYLEKIFQVPFQLRPLPPWTREQMLRGLLVPSLARPTGPPRQQTPADDPSTTPVDLDAFNDVVSSFAATSSTRQALSDAVDLTITSEELAQAQEVAELIGDTPRAVKRFANVYLLVKSIGAARGWPMPKSLVTLLAVASGLPRLAEVLFPALARGTELPEPSSMDSHNAEYRVFTEWVGRHSRRALVAAELTGWLELIERFRFPEGRAGRSLGRMDE